MSKPIVAACAMTLVEDCTLRLDDPVDGWLPELADMNVLADPNGPLTETVPAKRAITLRDLLTYTLGTGIVVAEPETAPIADALNALGRPLPDEWMRRLGALPLVHQPGERWMYDTAANVTGVLIARATGMTFGEALRQRICEPLGMKDTGFRVSDANVSRLATAYERDNSATGEPVVEEGPGAHWKQSAVFESGGGGLVSTADDCLAFTTALLGGGVHNGERVLSRPSVTLMTTDQVSSAQKADWPFVPGFWERRGWGFGGSVVTRRDDLDGSPGRFGWDGGYGTSWYIDPAERLVGVLMTQQLMASPLATPVARDFWTSAYQALGD